jgi:hypothetical protein
MVRCFPAQLEEQQILELIDVLRSRIGPVRYARFLVEPNRERNDTVGFIRFYKASDNAKCIEQMKSQLRWMLPRDTHYIQFVANHDSSSEVFDVWPKTQVRVYDMSEELICFATVYEDNNPPSVREVDNEEDVQFTCTTTTEPPQVKFMNDFYRRYLDKTEGKVIKLWEHVERKPDRFGIGYKEAMAAKEQARQDLISQLCEIEPGYEMHKASMIGWPLFKLHSEIAMVEKWQRETEEWSSECEQAEVRRRSELSAEQKSRNSYWFTARGGRAIRGSFGPPSKLI